MERVQGSLRVWRKSWSAPGRGNLLAEQGGGGGSGGTRASEGGVEEGRPSHRWGTSPLTIHICHSCTTNTTTTLYHTQCLAEARVGWELVFGAGELVELLAAGRDTHWTSCATSQTPPRRRRHLKPLISYTFQQILEGIFRRGEVCVDLGGFLRRVLLPKFRIYDFSNFRSVEIIYPLIQSIR